MQRKYELTIIYNDDDKIRLEGVAFAEGVLAKQNAKVLTRTELGHKTLAYEINKQRKGFYVFYVIQADPSAIAAITREYNLSHLLLRYLFVEIEDLTEGQIKKKANRDTKMRQFRARKASYANSQKESTVIDKDKLAEEEAKKSQAEQSAASEEKKTSTPEVTE